MAIGPKMLTPTSEAILSDWVRTHLSLAVHPFPNPDPLANLEQRVLAVLDPPLNLDHMPPTPLRLRLAELRTALANTNSTYLEASIGGFGPNYSVEGDGRQLVWRCQTWLEHDTTVKKLEPPSAAWKSLWRVFDRLNAWEWNNHHYYTPDILDGTSWSLRARAGGRIVEASGSNGYPGTPGPDPGPEFTAFCRAISRLAGGRAFE